MFARQRSEIQRLQSQRPAAGSRLDPSGQRGRVALKTRSAVAQDAFVFSTSCTACTVCPSFMSCGSDLKFTFDPRPAEGDFDRLGNRIRARPGWSPEARAPRWVEGVEA